MKKFISKYLSKIVGCVVMMEIHEKNYKCFFQIMLKKTCLFHREITKHCKIKKALLKLHIKSIGITKIG